jgi:hypothetical protein
MKLLSEILDQPYDFKEPRKIQMGKSTSGHMHMYNFKSPNDKYEVEYNKSPSGTHSHMVFGSDKAGYGMSNSEGRNAHRVFSTVLSTTKHYLQNNPDVKGIHFTGEKDSKGRNGTYDMLAKRFTTHTVDADGNKKHNFTTTDKKDPNSDYAFKSYYIDRKHMKGVDD